MKAFILAAGTGQRLRPITSAVPKCLVPVDHRPLLGVWLDLCERHGIGEVLVNTHHLAEQVADFVDAYRGGVRVTLVHEPTLLGSAGTIAANVSFVEKARDCFLLYGDNLTDMDLGAMLRFHRTRRSAFTIGAVSTERPHEKGILVTDPSGRVISFEEKPRQPLSRVSNAGVHVADVSLLQRIPLPDAKRGPLDLGRDVLPGLVGQMYAYPVDEFIADIGTPETYRAALTQWQRSHPQPSWRRTS